MPTSGKNAIDSVAKARQAIKAVQGASQREEWEKESATAMRNAYFTAGDLALKIIMTHLEREVDNQNKELGHAEDTLFGENDSNHREQLELGIKAMKDHRDELEHSMEAVERNEDALDTEHNMSDIAGSDNDSDPVELAYDAAII